MPYFLTDEHPDISTVTDDIVTVPLCGLNENGNCKEDIVFEMRKCHGDLLYRFPEQNFNVLDRLNLYICFGTHTFYIECTRNKTRCRC
jgi:hypothetical protein